MTPIEQVRHGDNVMLGGSRYFTLDQPDQEQFALAIANIEKRSHQLIPLDFFPHGVCTHPPRQNLLVCCEKKGPNGAIVDIEQLAMVKKLPLPENRSFYGHCAFSADGSQLFTTEVLNDTKEGLITIRDGESGEITGEFPSFGQAPHECQLLDDGQTLVVSNGGGNRNGAMPNIAYIDMNTQKLIKQEKPSSFSINTGHFAVAPDGALVVVSAPREGRANDDLGGVSIQPSGKPLRTVSSPKKTVNNMIGEALSVATFDEQTIVTHPDGDMITVWSMKNRALLKRFDLPKPRGVALTRDKQHVVVAYGEDTSLMLLNKDTLEFKPASHFRYSYIAGSHVYNLAKLLHIA